MSWTKRQFVDAAFASIGYASHTYDIEPEQMQFALRAMDSMMGTWNGLGIRLGYPIPSDPDNSDLDDLTSVSDSANEAIYANLAIRIAPLIGKTVSAETRQIARSAYLELLNRATKPQEMQFPETLPRGAGHKPVRYDDPFVDAPSDPLLTGDDGPIEFS